MAVLLPSRGLPFLRVIRNTLTFPLKAAGENTFSIFNGWFPGLASNIFSFQVGPPKSNTILDQSKETGLFHKSPI
jgi:hypothetical protein